MGEVSLPDDFGAYEVYRRTGELPKAEESEARESEPVKPAKETSEASTADESVDAETGSESETEQEGQEHKPKGGFQRRIKQLTDRNKDLERRLAEVTAGSAEKPAGEPAEAKPEAEAKPKLSDFDTYEEYEAAKDTWTAKKLRAELLEEIRKEQAEAKQKDEQATKQTEWSGRVKDVAAKHSDYSEVMESVEDIQLNPAVVLAITESDLGPELGYQLARNRAELERIAVMSPAKALLALGKFEASISTPVEKAKPAVTKAPKPPAPVGGVKGAEMSISDENISFADYERLRREQLSRR